MRFHIQRRDLSAVRAYVSSRIRPKWNPSRLLLLIGLPFGLFIVFLQPAWLGQDESVHFPRAWQIAGGDFTEEKSPEGLASRAPREFLEDISIVTAANLEAVLGEAGPSLDGYGDILFHRADSGETVLIPTWATDVSSPLPYIPAAVMMAPLRSLGMPTIWQLWAGRLGSLVAYLGLAFLAIQVSVRWQWTITSMALFPPLLVQGATLGYDAVTLGAFFLLVAVAGRVGTRSDFQSAVELLGTGLLLALSKPPYYLFLLPIACGLATRRQIKSTLGCLIPAVVGLFWSIVLAPSFSGPVSTISGIINVDPESQLGRIAHEPLEFFWHGVLGVVKALPVDYIPGWIPGPFPSLTISAWVGVGTACLIALATDDGVRSHGERLVAVSGSALVLVVICVADFAFFTEALPSSEPHNFDSTSPRWRYLAPLIGPLLLAFPRLPQVGGTAGLFLVSGTTAFVAISYLVTLSF